MLHVNKCQLCETRRPSICESCLKKQLYDFYHKRDEFSRDIESELEKVAKLKSESFSLKGKITQKEELTYRLQNLDASLNEKKSLSCDLHSRKQLIEDDLSNRKKSINIASQKLAGLSHSTSDYFSKEYLTVYRRSELLQNKLHEYQKKLITRVLDMYQLHWQRDLVLNTQGCTQKSAQMGSEFNPDSIDSSLAYRLSKLSMGNSKSDLSHSDNDTGHFYSNFFSQVMELNASVTISGIPVCIRSKEKMFLNPDCALTLSFICIFLAQYTSIPLPCPLQLPSPDQKPMTSFSSEQMLYIMYNIVWISWNCGIFSFPRGITQSQLFELMQYTGFWLVQLRTKPLTSQKPDWHYKMGMDFDLFHRLYLARLPIPINYSSLRSRSSSKPYQLIS